MLILRGRIIYNPNIVNMLATSKEFLKEGHIQHTLENITVNNLRLNYGDKVFDFLKNLFNNLIVVRCV